MLGGERQPEPARARLPPEANERTDRVHRALVEARHGVQVETEGSDASRDLATDATERKSVRAGERAREVERRRSLR
jgi:hypothetical protein